MTFALDQPEYELNLEERLHRNWVSSKDLGYL